MTVFTLSTTTLPPAFTLTLVPLLPTRVPTPSVVTVVWARVPLRPGELEVLVLSVLDVELLELLELLR